VLDDVEHQQARIEPLAGAEIDPGVEQHGHPGAARSQHETVRPRHADTPEHAQAVGHQSQVECKRRSEPEETGQQAVQDRQHGAAGDERDGIDALGPGLPEAQDVCDVGQRQPGQQQENAAGHGGADRPGKVDDAVIHAPHRGSRGILLPRWFRNA
jgi:hypothetical protein